MRSFLVLVLLSTALVPIAAAGPASDAAFAVEDTSCRVIVTTSLACAAWRADAGALGVGACAQEPPLAGNEAIWLLWAVGTASDSASGGRVCASMGERAGPIAAAADQLIDAV